ncbi:hypothetical protein XNA1_550004 [Xenorhabdus nematophila str. Anatoliense]|nr:hypothetical protein XNA1_2330004 [Xenorhabdus nematophila str. Anatoliense]CEE95541.1 hypothetical protein XNA1_550004 [Xenorhabdus nematophila str. Anatoliense]
MKLNQRKANILLCLNCNSKKNNQLFSYFGKKKMSIIIIILENLATEQITVVVNGFFS